MNFPMRSLRRTAIYLLNRLPLNVAVFTVEALWKLGQFRIAGFAARHYVIPNMETLPIPRENELVLVNDGSSIAQLLFFLGARGYEGCELELWKRLCSVSRSVCEVGGNIGAFTVIGARASRQASYRVYEPNPRSANSLRKNVKLNGLANVEVIEAAVVGDRLKNRVVLHIPVQETGKPATGAYIADGEGIDRPSVERFDVATVFSGDLEEFDLIKLDVEGAEYEILSSIGDHQWSLRPTILVELRRRTPRLREWIMHFARANGYETWALSSPKLMAVPIESLRTTILQEQYSTRDLVVIPQEKIHLIKEHLA
jgi:FkbM family methyltransferase